jgi:carbonic anhydrase
MKENITPNKALELLKEGNQRFVNNTSKNRNLIEEAIKTSEGQKPIAVILSCLDSRSSADIIFDQPIGGVFSARVAGNIVNDDILGSMEFACAASTAKLVMVVGHTSCGAIKGACDDVKLGNLTGLLEKIQPAIDAVKKPTDPEERNGGNDKFVNKVTKKNVILTMDNIRKRSEILNNLEKEGKIIIVGGVHDLSTGEINYIDQDGGYNVGSGRSENNYRYDMGGSY